MSLLEELRKNKLKLKATETLVTYADGKKCIENGPITTQLEEKSFGFVVDTKPDIIPACILENKLFLGSQDSVDLNNIQKLGITHILSVGIETPKIETESHTTCKFLPCLDLPETDLNTVCQDANQFLSDAFNNNGVVLVHCNAGVSRSSSIVIGYLMKYRNFTFQQAYELVKLKRPCIQPNIGFLEQLKRF